MYRYLLFYWYSLKQYNYTQGWEPLKFYLPNSYFWNGPGASAVPEPVRKERSLSLERDLGEGRENFVQKLCLFNFKAFCDMQCEQNNIHINTLT